MVEGEEGEGRREVEGGWSRLEWERRRRRAEVGSVARGGGMRVSVVEGWEGFGVESEREERTEELVGKDRRIARRLRFGVRWCAVL